MVHMPTEGAPDVLTHVSANVRRLRAAAELSQAALAERSGISRRTIIKLEAGEANISLSGLDQLAHALGTTFVELVAAPSAPRSRIDAVAWRGRADASVAVLLASSPASAEAQLWSWTLGAGDRYDAEPDAPGWHEMILVSEGGIRVEREDGTTELRAGDHLAFSSAQRYSYVAVGDVPARFVRVVVS